MTNDFASPTSDGQPKQSGHVESDPALNLAPPEYRLARFHQTLMELTPRVYVTPVLIGVNVLLFILMTVSGVSLVDPTVPNLLRWGANFGPLTLSGEWWRLFTCCFIHIGIIHILFNMWCLTTAGPLVERMIGNVGFLVLYLVAGVGGSVASLLWNPMLVGAGASGAIFGVYGVLVCLLARQRGSIPAEALTQLRNSGLAFLAYNLIFGLTQPNIDSAAHIGGLIAGLVCGVVVSQPIRPEARASRLARNLLMAGLGAGLLIAGMAGLTARHAGVAKIQLEMQRFEGVERKALEAYDDAAAKAGRGELTDAAFADLLERDVLPDWRAASERLAALKEVPPSLQSYVSQLLEYMRLRQGGWELFVQALREDSTPKAQQAMEMHKQAVVLAQRLGGGK